MRVLLWKTEELVEGLQDLGTVGDKTMVRLEFDGTPSQGQSWKTDELHVATRQSPECAE